MVTSLNENREVLCARVATILSQRPEVLDAYLFGSVARGDTHGESDVDVAVWIDESVDCEEGYGLDSDLAADLMAGLHRNDVDVVLLNSVGPVLYHRVLRDGVRVLSRDSRATSVREGKALSRYCDFLPTLAIVRSAERRPSRDARAVAVCI